MDLFDPFSVSAPPRYAIESDSEDSEFEDPDAGPRPFQMEKAKARAREPVVDLSWAQGRTSDGPKTVLVLVGEAGEEWERRLTSVPDEHASVTVDGKRVSS
jgi:hypothetical protein